LSIFLASLRPLLDPTSDLEILVRIDLTISALDALGLIPIVTGALISLEVAISMPECLEKASLELQDATANVTFPDDLLEMS